MCSVTRTATKIISCPLHSIISISPAVCSALLNCYDSAHIRLWAASRELNERFAEVTCGIIETAGWWRGGFSSRGNSYNPGVSVPLMLWSPALLAADEVSSSAEQQQEDQTQASNKDIIQTCQSPSFRSLAPSLCFVLCVSSCLSLLAAALWSACQHCRRLCSLRKSFNSDCQWNFVSVSQLSTQSPTHLSDTAVTLCLVMIARLRGVRWGILRSSCLFNYSWVIHCEIFDVCWAGRAVQIFGRIFDLNFNWTSHVVNICPRIKVCLVTEQSTDSRGLVINWYWCNWQSLQHNWGSTY